MQAAFRRDGVAGVGMECGRSDDSSADGGWRGKRECADRGAITSKCAGGAASSASTNGGTRNTSCRASNCTTGFANGHCWDLAGNAAHCAGES
ncbi:MAG: hypothetical protein WDM87_15915 [Terracidiphilus sp.]